MKRGCPGPSVSTGATRASSPAAVVTAEPRHMMVEQSKINEAREMAKKKQMELDSWLQSLGKDVPVVCWGFMPKKPTFLTDLIEEKAYCSPSQTGFHQVVFTYLASALAPGYNQYPSILQSRPSNVLCSPKMQRDLVLVVGAPVPWIDVTSITRCC